MMWMTRPEFGYRVGLERRTGCSANRSGKRIGALAGAVVAAVLGAACAATPAGASDANLAQAQQQAALGAKLFDAHCSSCHGDRGQGQAGGPTIIGAGALPTYSRNDLGASPVTTDPIQLQMRSQTQPPGGASKRIPFRTAADVYQFMSQHMPLPQERAGTLEPKEYWAILNFMLIAHGIDVPEGGVGPGNASTIQL